MNSTNYLSALLLGRPLTKDFKRHKMIIEKIKKQNQYDVFFLGDSITHLLDHPKYFSEKWVKQNENNHIYFNQQFKGTDFLNAGIIGEQTTHLYSRLKHGLSDVKSKHTVMLIGTNDTKTSKSAQQVVNNIKKSIQLIQQKNANTQIILYAIFPRGESLNDTAHLKNQSVNQLLSHLPKTINNLKYVDINQALLGDNNKVTTEYFYDFLHLTLDAYKIWIKSIKKEIDLGSD